MADKGNKNGFGVLKIVLAALFLILDVASAAAQTIPSALNLPSPHRVVSVHNSRATSWNGSGLPWDYTSYAEIKRMLETAVVTLTGEANGAAAWRRLIPYNSGEAVAIKLNWNNGHDWNTAGKNDPNPSLANAIVEALKAIGVPSNRIWLVDPSRYIPDPYRNRITDREVKFYVSPGIAIGTRLNVFPSSFVANGSAYSSQSTQGDGYRAWINPAQIFVDAAHIINIPKLKYHGGASISLGLKNHFGSISEVINADTNQPNMHNYFFVTGSRYRSDRNYLADINNNPIFRNKTRLIIADGITSCPADNNTWRLLGNTPMEMLFAGADPVATDSVLFDYLNAEARLLGRAACNDDILRYAAGLGLGVFEHWAGPNNRTYRTIDYRAIDLDNSGNAPQPPQDLEVQYTP